MAEGAEAEVPSPGVADAAPSFPADAGPALRWGPVVAEQSGSDDAVRRWRAPRSPAVVAAAPTAPESPPPAGVVPALLKGAREVARRMLGVPARNRLVPALRAYTRFMPRGSGKSALWRWVIAPHFGWLAHDFEVSTRFGGRLRGNTQDFIQRHVYYFGLWEPNLTAFLARRLRPGDVFIDVGANIGYFTLQAAKLLGPTGSVVAIEASPSIYDLLTKNLALNDARNVRAVNLAVADRPSLLQLFRGPIDNCGGTSLVADGTPGSTFECVVNAEPLGEIVTAEEWRRARLVKIDVEGAEADVVAGMLPLLARAPRDLELVVEIAPDMLEKQGKRPEDVLQIFRAAGFHAYRIENDYTAASYLNPTTARRPARITEPVVTQTDVVFSRTDAAVL